MSIPLFKRTGVKLEMSFTDHLEALRWHIARSLLAIMTCGLIVFIYIEWIFDHIITGPLHPDFITYTLLCRISKRIGMGSSLCLPPPLDASLQTTSFSSQFMSSITISVGCSFILSFPYIFWEVWKFIRPALTAREKRATRGMIGFVSFFFFIGAAFGYFLIAPFTFSFLSNYSISQMGIVVTKPTLSDYTENLIDILFGSAVAFQMPVLSYVLTKMGLLSPDIQRLSRKYAYVGILVAAAIITPSSDWLSQLVVFIPLALLYEISIGVSKRITRVQRRKNAEWD